MRGVLASTLFALVMVPVAAHARSVPPQNTCESLPSASAFQMKLATAVANRDVALLESITHPQVHLDFGGGSGWAIMRERLDDPDYRLWEELGKVLRLGCGTSVEDELYMPWYWGEDLGTEDAFSTFIVTGAQVPLLRAPTYDPETMRVEELLDWEVVTFRGEWNEEAEFAEVTTSDGRRGFVAWSHLRSQVDYRLIASRDTGDWRITVFIAGD